MAQAARDKADQQAFTDKHGANRNWEEINRPILTAIGAINRIGGTLQVVGGVLQVGGALFMSPVLGLIVGANGVDNIIAGIRNWGDGEHHQTVTSWSLSQVAQAAGVDQDTADEIGDWGDTAIGVVAGLKARAPKARGKPKIQGEPHGTKPPAQVEPVRTPNKTPVDQPSTGPNKPNFGGCFVEGTMIQTPLGNQRIETLKRGDEVMTRDENTPESPWQVGKVSDIINRVSPIWKLTVNGKDILTTAEHPFWVIGKGWVGANQIRMNDKLRTLTGQVTVEQSLDTHEATDAYNVSIDPSHTYFVGGDDWGFVVWAHNTVIAQGCAQSPISPAPNNAKEILDQLPGKKGKTGPIKEVPNEQALRDLFDTLSKEGKTVNPGTYPGVVKELPDGTMVRMRPGSKSGGATLDITMPDGKIYKVH
ncbi:MAG TPA: polymorphic toxin-type HINT domain-containing protein, partial [Gemmatales bacterium]|nr:polymorphic toxin-type HINT domain-containing protein [Gemmatales bacterium]